jgi:Smg protein
MIDILVYLLENYQPDACPAPAVLTKKLTAAGFAADDISAAMLWLDGLTAGEHLLPMCGGSDAMRIYTTAEQEKLSVEARGFLAFLEQAEAIDPVLRETIIERALALPSELISVDRLKVIVLAVVWRRQHAIDALILEELLADDEEDDDSNSSDETVVTRILLN